MPYPLQQTIPCPNCNSGTLRRFAEHTFHNYYHCRLCQRERLIPKDVTYAARMIKKLVEVRGK